MLKKIGITAVAAAALLVPLAGVANADPSSDNPGLPGTFGTAPGSVVSQIAQLDGSVPDVAAPPGSVFSTLTPGQTGSAGESAAHSCSAARLAGDAC